MTSDAVNARFHFTLQFSHPLSLLYQFLFSFRLYNISNFYVQNISHSYFHHISNSFILYFPVLSIIRPNSIPCSIFVHIFQIPPASHTAMSYFQGNPF